MLNQVEHKPLISGVLLDKCEDLLLFKYFYGKKKVVNSRYSKRVLLINVLSAKHSENIYFENR